MLIMKADLAAFHKIFEKAGSENEPVLFPTDTIYGIGAHVNDAAANEKIFNIKGREHNKPFPVLAGTIEQVLEIAEPNDSALNFLSNCPFPCTIIIKARYNLNKLLTLNGNVAVRIPKNTDISVFLKDYGAVTATSANLSGMEYLTGIEEKIKTFRDKIKFYLYKNECASSASAIADFTSSEPKLVRKSDALSLDTIVLYAKSHR